MIHERFVNLKYKHGNWSFGGRGYYVDTAGKSTKKMIEYIRNQLDKDKLHNQLMLNEYIWISSSNLLQVSDSDYLTRAARNRRLYSYLLCS